MKQFALLLLLLPTLLLAEVGSTIPPGKWQCLAFDLRGNSYQGIGDNTKGAMKNANIKCHHTSSLAKTCKSAQSYCEQGPLSIHEDTCLVTDESGHSWDTTGQDACKSAMELCVQFQFLYNIASQCNIKHR